MTYICSHSTFLIAKLMANGRVSPKIVLLSAFIYVFILMNFPLLTDTMSIRMSFLYFKKTQVEVSIL